MQKKYFFIVFAVMVILASPAAGSLTKITAGAPVYIGEQNLDISAGLQGCRNIDWWEPGADTDGPPQKNITIIRTLEDSDIAFGYTISPEIYSGYEGIWYCEGKRPLRPVFEVRRPQLQVRFWDLDNDVDVTGKTIPVTTNITYRIDTNLDAALQLRYRPDMLLLDSFYTISLSDPGGKVLSSVYTGSYGKPDSHGILLDKNPIISASPYLWKDGSAWDRTSRNIQGDLIYLPGTYTVTVTQNLNHMKELYDAIAAEDKTSVLDSTATVTFYKPEPIPVPTVTVPATVLSGTVTTEPAVSLTTAPAATTELPTRTTVPAKTTYAPLPSWVVIAALGLSLMWVVRHKR